jgi:hypothetical protein
LQLPNCRIAYSETSISGWTNRSLIYLAVSIYIPESADMFDMVGVNRAGRVGGLEARIGIYRMVLFRTSPAKTCRHIVATIMERTSDGM